MVAKTKVSDDYLGALLRVQGTPNEVIVSLLKNNSCNVEGLRVSISSTQGKCSRKLGINVDLLDGLPHKIRAVFQALDIPSSPEETEVLDSACNVWGPERPHSNWAEDGGPSQGFFEGQEGEEDNDAAYYEKDTPYGLEILEGLFYSTLRAIPFLDLDRDTSDEGLLKQADIAMSEIEKVPQLACLSVLLKRIVSTFESFKCNNVPARLFRVKALEVMIFLGSPREGLIDTARRLELPLSAASFKELEHHLSRFCRFFNRYTTDKFLDATLVGRESKEKFEQYHHILQRLTDLLWDEYKVSDSGGNLQLKMLEPFDIAYDVKRNVDAALASPEAFERIAKEYGAITGPEIEALRDEVNGVSEALSVIEAAVDKDVNNTPQKLFRYLELTDFWLSSFGTKQIVSVEAFCSALEVHFRDESEGAVEDYEQLRLITDTITDLKNALVSFENDKRAPDNLTTASTMLLDCRNIANLFRGVPRTQDLFLSVQFVYVTLKNHTRCLLPPLPRDEVVWESVMARQMLMEAIETTRGWVKIAGPSQSGKSSRLLNACHSHLTATTDKDFVWIDLAGVGSDMEAVSRSVQQLGLRQVCSKADFFVVFQRFLSSLQPGSVVVFDNVCDTIIQPLGVSILDIFYSVMLGVSAKVAGGLCMVLVITDSVTDSDSDSPLADVERTSSSSRIFFERQIEIAPLPLPAARVLATTLFPEDPESMIKASRRLPGLMARLTRYCDLECVRQIAGNGRKDEDLSHCNAVIAQYVGSSLSGDERIVASSLLRNMPPFDISLAWSLGRELFKQDKVRWKVAWDGVVSKGWLNYTLEMGYTIPQEAIVVGSVSVPITEQKQWECYLAHWCREAVRINTLAKESLCALQHFDGNRRHFSTLFATFYASSSTTAANAAPSAFSPSASFAMPAAEVVAQDRQRLEDLKKASAALTNDSKNTAVALLSVKRGLSDVNLVARTLAGNVEYVLKTKYSLTGGTAISKSIFLEIAKVQGPSDFIFLVAAVDHAVILKRMVLMKSGMLNADDKSAEGTREIAEAGKEMKSAILDSAKNLQLGLENHYIPGQVGVQSRGERGAEKAMVLAKGLALLGLFLEDLGLARTRKDDISRALSEAVSIWKAVGETSVGCVLYAEVLQRLEGPAKNKRWSMLGMNMRRRSQEATEVDEEGDDMMGIEKKKSCTVM